MNKSYFKQYLDIISEGVFSDSQQEILEKIKTKFIECCDDQKIDAEKVWNQNLKAGKISIFRTVIQKVYTMPKNQVLKDPTQAYQQIQQTSVKPGTTEYLEATHRHPEKYGYTMADLKKSRNIWRVKFHTFKSGDEDTDTYYYNDGYKCIIEKGKQPKYVFDKDFRSRTNIPKGEKADQKNVIRFYIHNSTFEDLPKDKQEQTQKNSTSIIDYIDGTRKKIKRSEILKQSNQIRKIVFEKLGLQFIKKDQFVYYYKNTKHISLEYFGNNFVKLCRNQIKQSEDIGQIPVVEIVKSKHFKQQYDVRLDYCAVALCTLLDTKFKGQQDYKKE